MGLIIACSLFYLGYWCSHGRVSSTLTRSVSQDKEREAFPREV